MLYQKILFFFLQENLTGGMCPIRSTLFFCIMQRLTHHTKLYNQGYTPVYNKGYKGGDYPPKPEDRSGDGVTTTVTDALTEILILGLSNYYFFPKLKLFSDTP